MDRSDTREWLTTNGLGGYASATACGAHTRRYHGLLVAALEPPGQRTVLLSRFDETVVVGGEVFERGDFVPLEKVNWDARAVFIENRYHTREAWLDKDGREFHPGTNYYVGGNTKFYGAALLLRS